MSKADHVLEKSLSEELSDPYDARDALETALESLAETALPGMSGDSFSFDKAAQKKAAEGFNKMTREVVKFTGKIHQMSTRVSKIISSAKG